MAKTNVVTITQERQFAFPPEILEALEPGDEYLLWQTDDTIVLKKITQTISFDTLFQRIEALGPDSDQPTEAEICDIVNTIRHERAQPCYPKPEDRSSDSASEPDVRLSPHPAPQ